MHILWTKSKFNYCSTHGRCRTVVSIFHGLLVHRKPIYIAALHPVHVSTTLRVPKWRHCVYYNLLLYTQDDNRWLLLPLFPVIFRPFAALWVLTIQHSLRCCCCHCRCLFWWWVLINTVHNTTSTYFSFSIPKIQCINANGSKWESEIKKEKLIQIQI